MNENGAVPKTKKRFGRRSLRILLSVFVMTAVIAVAAVVIVRLFFVAHNVAIRNDTIYDPSVLMEAVGFRPGDQVFAVDKDLLSEIPYRFPYVAEADVSVDFPNNVTFSFTSDKPLLSMKCDEGYLILNRSFKVLETVQTPSKGTVSIFGIEPQNAHEGYVLPDVDNVELTVLRDCLNALEENDWLSLTDYIDFSKIYNIRFSVAGTWNVQLGTSDNIDKKVTMAKYVSAINDPTRKADINVKVYSEPRYSIAE